MIEQGLSAAARQRRLAAALWAMLAAAALMLCVLGWRYALGPRDAPQPPSVRVRALPPGGHVWADAPRDARYLPEGVTPAEADSLKLLVLRDRAGQVHGFYLPRSADGRVGVPVTAGVPAAPGLACLDMAPDVDAGDLACRQAAPGFEFALRHRWSLQGRALSAGTPDLPLALGQEREGDWLLEPLR